jgi:hypothetical protein
MCKESHVLCGGVGNTPLDLPTRLIHITEREDPKPGDFPLVNLVLTDQMEPKTEYLALSHCWGKDMLFKLLCDNLESCYNNIDYKNLSTNLQDAIFVTQSLGYSYIWIDSLCIVQDSTADWKKEAKRMGSVYSGAVCTISSTGSASSMGGCFKKRDILNLKPCKIAVSSPDSVLPAWLYAQQDDVFDFERYVDKSPLNTRAWVLQERLLSRRIIHFGSGMIYWECCRRSASELVPQGWVYKQYPEDFKDHYYPKHAPEFRSRVEAERAEGEGRGFAWIGSEMMRLRPPPVELDPDAPPASRTIWQRKRGFWKNILKFSETPWSSDVDMADSSGFRAAFEKLRRGGASTDQVGRSCFSQLWYEIVESYSRGRLSFGTDKLVALSGIQKEVERCTGYTYMDGLWKEHLLTDLLWFAAEGPGTRLVDKQGVSIAPTWSWASIEGSVAIDLLPQNSRMDVSVRATLTTILKTEGFFLPEQKLVLSGPLLNISKLQFDGTIWNIAVVKGSRPSARFYPDNSDDIDDVSELACLSFLSLDREKSDMNMGTSSEDIQGLVLRHIPKQDNSQDVYERVGYFTTSYIKKSRNAQKARVALKEADIQQICLVGRVDRYLES